MSDILNGMKSLMGKLDKTYITEGAWGYNPQQQDSALDIRDSWLKQSLGNLITLCRMNGSKDAGEAWARIGAMEWIMDVLIANKCEFFIPKEMVRQYGLLLRICESDQKWQQEWDEPDTMRSSLAMQRQKYEKYKSYDLSD